MPLEPQADVSFDTVSCFNQDCGPQVRRAERTVRQCLGIARLSYPSRGTYARVKTQSFNKLCQTFAGRKWSCIEHFRVHLLNVGIRVQLEADVAADDEADAEAE